WCPVLSAAMPIRARRMPARACLEALVSFEHAPIGRKPAAQAIPVPAQEIGKPRAQHVSQAGSSNKFVTAKPRARGYCPNFRHGTVFAEPLGLVSRLPRM